jgi:hypothetical protein
MAMCFQRLQSQKENTATDIHPVKDGCRMRSSRPDDSPSPSATRMLVQPLHHSATCSPEVDSSLHLLPTDSIASPTRFDPMFQEVVQVSAARPLHPRRDPTVLMIETPDVTTTTSHACDLNSQVVIDGGVNPAAM